MCMHITNCTIRSTLCSVCRHNFSYRTDLYGADQTISVNVGTEEELRQHKVCTNRHTWTHSNHSAEYTKDTDNLNLRMQQFCCPHKN